MIGTTRNTIIGSGAAENSMIYRWKKHSNASILKEYINISNKFYSSYPNEECEKKELITGINVKGSFQDLSLRQVIGMKWVKTHSMYDDYLEQRGNFRIGDFRVVQTKLGHLRIYVCITSLHIE